jgi:hypothetical protein
VSCALHAFPELSKKVAPLSKSISMCNSRPPGVFLKLHFCNFQGLLKPKPMANICSLFICFDPHFWEGYILLYPLKTT